MSDTKIKTSNIGNLAITHDKLHTTMDLTAKTVTIATPSAATHPATKAYVDTEVANLIDSAPGTLNTLNELAAAVNDDANFNATIASSIATKLPLAGGTMTGALNMGSNNITTTGKVLFANVYATEGDLPSASTYHGMFAHVHATGKGYYAHAGNWVQLANAGATGGGYEDADTAAYLATSQNKTINTAGGNVGIGTTSPSAPIDVVTNSVVYAAEFTQSNTSNGDGVLISVGSTAAADYALTVRSDAGNTSVLAAKADGKVGIGVFTPDEIFHILGSTAAPSPVVKIQSDATANATSSVLLMSRLADNANKNLYIKATLGNLAITGDSGYGNVGIGVSSPGTRLQVAGTQNVPSGTSKGMLLVRADGSSHGLQMGVTGSAPWGSWIQAQDNNISSAYPLTLQPGGGNVGIGTTSPVEPLHVQFSNNTGADTGIVIKNTNTGTTANFAGLQTQAVNGAVLGTLASADYDAWGVGTFAGSQSNHPTYLIANNAVKMTILANGNVGIGVNPTNAKLEVVATSGEVFRADSSGGAYRIVAHQTGVSMQGTISVAGTVHTSESQSNNVTKLLIDNTGGLPTVGNQQGGAITFRTFLGDANMREAAEIRGVYLGVAADSNKNRGGLVFRTMQPSGMADRMLINEDGNVGISTSSPLATLDVNGVIRHTTEIESNSVYKAFSIGSNRATNDYGGLNKEYWAMSVETPGTNTTGESSHHAYGALKFSGVSTSDTTLDDVLVLRHNGNVGIGTNVPQTALHVSGGSDSIRVENTGTGNYGLEIFRSGTKGASFAWGDGNANLEIKNYRNDAQADGPYANIDFFTGGTNATSPNYNPDLRMRIQQTGEVGIGTSNPTSKLHVDGTIVGFDGQTTKSVHTIGTNVGGFPRRRFFRHISTGSGDQVVKLMRYARHWWGVGNVEIIVRGVYYGGDSKLGHFTVNGHTRSGLASIASHNNNIGTNTPYADNYSSSAEACDISIVLPSYQQYFLQFNIVYQYVVSSEAAVGHNVGQSNGIYLFPSVREFI